MKLSALQNKVGKTDMMSLYKSLTSDAKVSHLPQTIQGWKSVSHPGPKALKSSRNQERHFPPKYPDVPHTSLLPDYDRIVEEMHVHPKATSNGETFWTKQHPIRKTDAQILHDLTERRRASAELLNKKEPGKVLLSYWNTDPH